MGEAKRRQSAQTVGRPWPPKLPPLPPGTANATPATRELQRLAMLGRMAETNTRTALQAARAATDNDARDQILDSILQGACGLLEGEVRTAYAANAESARLWSTVACRKGCSWCCHIQVETTIVEAIVVSRQVAKSESLTASVLAAAPAVAGTDSVGRLRKRVACPLLVDGACSVYDHRPGACRAHVSLDDKACETALKTAGTPDEARKIPTVVIPRKIDTAISFGVRRACAAENLQSCDVELTAALYLLATDPTAVSRWLAGETVFTPYP